MYRRLFIAFLAVVLLSTSVKAQDWAKERLENSPRHLEWVTIKHGDREVAAFVAYPEVAENATAVVVIHEIFGLTDWVNGVTDQLAEAGYIAIAPDLLSGMAPGGGNSSDFEDTNAVRRAISMLPPDRITADLNAAVDYVSKLPACNGKVVVGGFCWGGGQTFRFATSNDQVKAAFVFYGAAPEDKDAIARISAPVYGFYGENDARINMSIRPTKMLMTEASKTFEPVIYAGAGHGFLRAGEASDANEANKKARDEAWQRWKELLKGI